MTLVLTGGVAGELGAGAASRPRGARFLQRAPHAGAPVLRIAALSLSTTTAENGCVSCSSRSAFRRRAAAAACR
jgi:hypothetical protein